MLFNLIKFQFLNKMHKSRCLLNSKFKIYNFQLKLFYAMHGCNSVFSPFHFDYLLQHLLNSNLTYFIKPENIKFSSKLLFISYPLNSLFKFKIL
ncbi:unnamed protein product [Blepharisma stoltei]|uniref:Uncharacterized protein n=1 Tax=Blepharisma stoltei TaxID=1481888 RepID=A0AAU9IMX8_9CILI|nr:unnamed protein product [Blepharisma stoltei]